MTGAVLKKIVLLSILVLSCFLLVQCTHQNKILRVSDGAITTLPEVIEDLEEVQILFVGELHDVKRHHDAQLQIIRSMHEIGMPIAIGLEMFQAEYQMVLDKWVQGTLAEDAFIKAYYANWQFPWPLYRDIFLYAREHAIPLLGLNVNPKIVRQVARHGFASLSKEQLRKLPGVSCNINPEYQAFIRRALRIHQSGKTFHNFCEAQMVWDTTMAWNLVKFLKSSPDYFVVVLAGGGHSWKLGIPDQVRNNSNIPFKVILPEVGATSTRATISTNETDYLWLGL